VNTDGLPEVTQVTGLKNVLRSDDEVCEICSEQNRDELLKAAPKIERGYLQVKGVFEDTDI